MKKNTLFVKTKNEEKLFIQAYMLGYLAGANKLNNKLLNLWHDYLEGMNGSELTDEALAVIESQFKAKKKQPKYATLKIVK